MITRRSFVSAVAAVVAAPAIVKAQDAPYVLGTLYPMSGLNPDFGEIYTKATVLAVEQIAEEKLLGRPIEIHSQDSQATPQGGAVGMTRLVNVDRAPYVLLGFTGVSKAAAPIGERSKTVMVNGGGVGPDLASLSPYFWNVIPLANQEIAALIPWLGAERLLRVAVVYVDDPLGKGLLAELQKGLPAIRGSVVGSFSIPPTAQQFGAIAARIREVKPDVVYFAVTGGGLLMQLAKQMRDNGVDQQLVTYSVGNLPALAALPEANGLAFTGQSADWTSSDPTTKRFVEGWRSKYKSDPTIYAQNYYNGTRLFALLVQQLERAGTPVSGEALLQQRQRGGKYEFSGGQVSFDENGLVTSKIQLSRFASGRVEVLRSGGL
jgi:branched-chain amino acid transport system substrate-binding protein